MRRNDKLWLVIIAAGCIATGIFSLCRDLQSTWYGVRGIFAGELPLFPAVLWLLVHPLLPLAKIVSGAGLWVARRWAWWASVAVLSVDFLLRLIGHIGAWSSVFSHPQPPPADGSSEGVVVSLVSMWPSSVTAIVSLISVIILLGGAMRRYFRDVSANEAMA